jgi:indoleamine 2,3-dioxygenase
MKLSDYDIDEVRGFVPGLDPLLALPHPYDAWDRVAEQLHLLTMRHRTHDVLAAIPLLAADGLVDVEQQKRGFLLLTAFANTWLVGANASTTIPACIAVPLIALARKLKRIPITQHSTIVLSNWRRLDPLKPLAMDNVDTLVSFRGSIDEKWFFLSTVGAELAGAPALPRLLDALDAAELRDHVGLARALETIASVIAATTTAFMSVRESCDPHIFYNHVRPFLASWPAPGVTYAGTDVGPVIYSGGSAAQSALLQSIDATLGIAHEHDLTRGFLMSMRDYMPPRHRAFIEDVGQRSQVRTVVFEADAPSTLRQAYDSCISAMDELRRKHMGLVSEYITKQMPPTAAAIGTGGTSFDDFLRQTRIETVRSKIGDQ